MSSDIAISVKNLSKTYRIFGHPGDRIKQAFTLGRVKFHKEFTALKDVSFEIRKGEAVGIIGRNGSGKSTLLQLICGILKSSSGSVKVNGRISALLELGSGFNPEFTGRENVYFQGAIMDISKAQMDARFDDIAAFADIGEFIDQPVWTYSSGMFVRLAFSVAVHVDPDILVVDEALSVGDAAFQFRCIERMQQLTDSGMTLLLVSHDISVIKAFCNQVLYLARGQVKKCGPADVVVEQYFLDIREDQQRHSSSVVPVSWKPPLVGSVKGMAFGTHQGSIVSARFETNTTTLSVTSNTRVCVLVNMEYAPNLAFPSLSLFLQDYRMIEISGKSFPLLSDKVVDGRVVSKLAVEFNAKLKAGVYFVTLRLEYREASGDIFPLDKQVGALSLVVSSSQSDLLGMVDIGMQLVSSDHA